MLASTTSQLSAPELLHIFHRSEIYLFLGAAIATVGIFAAAFSILRRRLEPLLLWFALFAILYGGRMWMTNQLLGFPDTAVFERIRVAIGFLVPIPAFFFLRSLDLLSRFAKAVVYGVTPVSIFLALATLTIGPRLVFFTVNNTLVTLSLLILAFSLFRLPAGSPETTLIRRGLVVFILTALYENIGQLVGPTWNVEPFGFIIFLGVLGYVAAHRTLAQEQQLSVIQKELEIAKRIQLSILPGQFPASISFRVAARYLPMTSVAGDFYDFLLADDTEAGLLIADVSGHGVPAALIASMVKLAATSQRASATQPSDLLHAMNSALCGNTQSQFVTAAYVYLNAATQELRYAAAAHPPMLLLRNGVVTEIIENGLMLAAFSFATYTTVAHPLEPGDRLLLYTDGVLEAADKANQEFGPERLGNLFKQTAHLPATDTADQIISTIRTWSATQNDDLTVLICDYTA